MQAILGQLEIAQLADQSRHQTAVIFAQKALAHLAVFFGMCAVHWAVTVAEVRKDPDGTYDVLGTKAGAPGVFDVSADRATVTANAGPEGGPQGGPQGAGHAAPGSTQQSAPSATASS